MNAIIFGGPDKCPKCSGRMLGARILNRVQRTILRSGTRRVQRQALQKVSVRCTCMNRLCGHRWLAMLQAQDAMP